MMVMANDLIIKTTHPYAGLLHTVNPVNPRLICVLFMVFISVLSVYPDGRALQLPTPEGDLAVYWFMAPEATRTIILGHGYLSHARINQLVIDYFLDRGYTVLAWDLPGHGNSWGQPGNIDSFMQYVRAFDAILVHARKQRPGDTLSFIGHSTSCAIFITWQRECWNTGASSLAGGAFPLEKIVLVAPLVRTWLYRLSGFGWCLTRRFIKEFKPRTSAGSHRPGYGQDFFDDPLTVKRMPQSWIEPYREWERQTRAWEADPLPLVILQGTSDTVLAWRHNIRFLTSAYPEARVEFIEGGWHCLLEEAEPWISEVYGILDREF